MSTNPTTAQTEADAGPRRLYPASILHLMEERPLLWYEDPEDYDRLLRDIFDETTPQGVLECIFVKNLVDYIWELRRMKKMKHTAINLVMPGAAAGLLAPPGGPWGNPEKDTVMAQAADVAYGAEEDIEEDKPSLADHMEEARVTPEMIHYKALNSEADRLQWISRECERLEGRFHRLLKDFEDRRASLAAMSKSLIDRERAEVVDVKEAA